jgi:chromosome segregation ATPase
VLPVDDAPVCGGQHHRNGALACCISLIHRYLLEPQQQLVDELKSDMQASEEEVGRLGQQQQHVVKAMAATEEELRELFKQHPELRRQLTAASS